jgi:HAD superfamily hydrolase (TIGR01509 family)
MFDGWIASCDVGLRKPDPEMYQHALEHTGARAEQTIYIDDRPEMVEAGKGAGLIAIRYESSRQLEQDLQKIGLNL